MAGILNFIHNKMFELPSGHTTRSGIPGKPTTYTWTSLGPDKVLYALYLGEANSTVLD